MDIYVVLCVTFLGLFRYWLGTTFLPKIPKRVAMGDKVTLEVPITAEGGWSVLSYKQLRRPSILSLSLCWGSWEDVGDVFSTLIISCWGEKSTKREKTLPQRQIFIETFYDAHNS